MMVSMLDWVAIAPSLVVMLTGMVVVGVDMFLPKAALSTSSGTTGLPPSRGGLVALSYLGLALPTIWVVQRLWLHKPSLPAFGRSMVLDDLSCFLSLAILAATALILVGADADARRRRIAVGEYYGLVLICAGAMMLLVSSTDFLMIFLNLEVLSLSLYVLTGITRRNPRANEAAVKYLVMGAFATCFLLLGVAFIYGATGTILLENVGQHLAHHPPTPLLKAGFGLVLVGFGFKIGAVPFHMWVPDVYEGAPTTTTAFMAVTVKAAAVGALARVLLLAAPGASSVLWSDLLWWGAVLTMVVGNLLALQQSSVKRMLAYSSIAHTGYALVALATMRATDGSFSPDGASAALFYLLVYTFMTLGAFVVLVYLGHAVEVPGHAAPEWQDAEHLDDLAGMGMRHPWAAAAMTIFLVSLGGIPPTAGFFGKFTVFASAVHQGHVVLAVIGVLASLVSMYYYLRVVVAMYMREATGSDEKPDRSIGLAVALAALATILLGVQPALFLEWAVRSITSLMS